MVVIRDTRNVTFTEFPNIHFSQVSRLLTSPHPAEGTLKETHENSDQRGPLFLPANLA